MAQTVYWVIYPVTGGTDPANNTTGAAFVRNGQDGAGVTAAASGSEAMPGGAGVINVDESTLPTSLSAGTSYKIAATIWDGTNYGGGTSTYVTVSGAIDTLPILDLAGSQTASLSGVVTASGDLQYTISLGGAQTASLSGSLDVAGDIEITPAPTLDLAGSQTAALGGVLSATGDLQYGLSTDLEQSGAAALSGSLSIAGDLEYSTAIFLDIAAQPITLAGAFAASGDLDPYQSLDLAGSRTAALSGSVTVTGDLQSVVPFDLAFSSAGAISGQVSVTGDLFINTEPLPVVSGGHAFMRNRFVEAKKRLALQRVLSYLTEEEPAEETKKIIRAVKAGKPVQDKKPPVVMAEVSAEKIAERLIPSRAAELAEIPDIDMQAVIKKAIRLAQERDDEDVLLLL